jgi:hypothetical protein
MYTYKGNNNQERASMKGQKEQKTQMGNHTWTGRMRLHAFLFQQISEAVKFCIL